jgi:hypothetical protein
MPEKMMVQQLETPSSALRYSLLNVKPIPFQDIVRIKGQSYTRRGIRYIPDGSTPQTNFENLQDFIAFRYEQIFEKMPMPERFSKEQLLEHFQNKAIDYVNKDKELKEQIEQGHGLLGIVQFFKGRFKKEIDSRYSVEANRFLNSNLPLSFFSRTSMFTDTYEKYLDVIERVVRRHELLQNLPGVRDKGKASKVQMSIMKRKLAPIIDQMDICTIESLSLRLYVSIWSANDIKEIEEPHFLDIKKLESAYFEEYCLSYEKAQKNTRRIIYELSKEYYPELMSQYVVSSSSTADMLGKLLLCEHR